MLVSVDLHMHVDRALGEKGKGCTSMAEVVDDEVVDRGRSIMDCGSGAFRAPSGVRGEAPKALAM